MPPRKRNKPSSHRGKTQTKTPRKPLERTCVATRTTHLQSNLLRILTLPASLSPWSFRTTHPDDLTIAIDWSRKLPGRSAWITPRAEDLQTALQRGAFQRSFKTPLRLPSFDELLQHTQDNLKRSFLKRLALARRAHALVSGQDPSREAMKHNSCKLLLLSNDLSPPQTQKLSQNAIRKSIPFATLPFDRDTLGQTLHSSTAQQTTCIAVTEAPFHQDLLQLALWLHQTHASPHPPHTPQSSPEPDLIDPSESVAIDNSSSP